MLKNDDTFYNILTLAGLVLFLQVVFIPQVVWLQYLAVILVTLAIVNNRLKQQQKREA